MAIRLILLADKALSSELVQLVLYTVLRIHIPFIYTLFAGLDAGSSELVQLVSCTVLRIHIPFIYTLFAGLDAGSSEGSTAHNLRLGDHGIKLPRHV